jgi:hypothetical protein
MPAVFCVFDKHTLDTIESRQRRIGASVFGPQRSKKRFAIAHHRHQLGEIPGGGHFGQF